MSVGEKDYRICKKAGYEPRRKWLLPCFYLISTAQDSRVSASLVDEWSLTTILLRDVDVAAQVGGVARAGDPTDLRTVIFLGTLSELNLWVSVHLQRMNTWLFAFLATSKWI